MKTDNLVATASTTVDAPVTEVWKALVTPETIKRYMFGAHVTSSFTEGSAITWSGDWHGKPYEDKGEILEVEPERLLRYSHYSPLTGAPDKPENYHMVTIELSSQGSGTRVSLSQDNNADESAREHSEQNWQALLGGLKKVVEEA